MNGEMSGELCSCMNRLQHQRRSSSERVFPVLEKRLNKAQVSKSTELSIPLGEFAAQAKKRGWEHDHNSPPMSPRWRSPDGNIWQIWRHIRKKKFFISLLEPAEPMESECYE